MNAPINLYFDVNTSDEITDLVDSDTGKYESFVRNLTYLFYPAYNIIQTLVLIIYVAPSILVILLVSMYLMYKLKSTFKPVDKII